MDRPNWYDNEDPNGPRSSLTIPPLRSWSGNGWLLLTLIVMFFLQLVLRSPDGFSLTEALQLNPEHLLNPLRWYEFVTYALLHSEYSLGHLGWNCLLLWFLGKHVEAMVRGRRQYLYFCAAAAVSASLAYVLQIAVTSATPYPMIGASGIVYAVVVAWGTYDPQKEIMLIFPPVAAKAWAIAAILMVASLFMMLMQGDDGVAHVAHLGGGVFGFVFVRYRPRFASMMAEQQAKKIEAGRQREADRRVEVDRILEKISESGIGSLTKAERRVLESASKDIRGKQ